LFKAVGADTPLAEQSTLRALAEGYSENRDSFQAFTCSFKVISGTSADFSTAIERGPTTSRVIADGIWVVSPSLYRYELNFDTEYLAQAIAKGAQTGQYSLPFPSQRYLSDGEFILSYTNAMNAGTIHASSRVGLGPELTPFNPGIFGANDRSTPARRIAEALNQEGIAELMPTANADDQNLITIRCAATDYRKKQPISYTDITLDTQQGFQPTSVSYYIGSETAPALQTIFTKYIKVDAAGYFPARSVRISKSREGSSVNVRELIVDDLQLGEPDKADLVVTLPKGVILNDGRTPGAQMAFERILKLAPSDLRSVFDTTQNAIALNTEVAGDNGLTVVRAWIIAVSAIVFAVLAFLLHRRHRSRKATLMGSIQS
jgi:hypothetical protein